jgi:myo-inositol-1(or 4)-monophosphatase
LTAPTALDSREILASNQLIHHEMLGFFADMFAGRNLAPLPSPAEYAARRAARLLRTAS